MHLSHTCVFVQATTIMYEFVMCGCFGDEGGLRAADTFDFIFRPTADNLRLFFADPSMATVLRALQDLCGRADIVEEAAGKDGTVGSAVVRPTVTGVLLGTRRITSPPFCACATSLSVA